MPAPLSLARAGLLPFVALQLALCAAGGAWAVSRYNVHQHLSDLPPFRNEPAVIAPLRDDPDMVSDERLTAILDRLQPRLRGKQPKINFVDHALRFWGVKTEFADSEALSGVEMRELLLDHRVFADAWGPKTEPFLIPDTRGVGVRTQEGQATASHFDHTIAGLGEVGTPLDYPVITPQGETTLRAILERSVKTFSLNQTEYEWSTLAFALYFADGEPWMTTEGQEITFDRLADRILRQRLAQGVCSGQHRLHALVMLLRIDAEDHSILSPEARLRITKHLQDVSARLVQTQHGDGYWDIDWAGVEPEGPARSGRGPYGPLSDRLLVTGHVLEWWALAPDEILPDKSVRVKAAGWLCDTLQNLTDAQVRSYYPFLTHAGRALSLWRGVEAADWLAAHPVAAKPE